MLTSFRDVLLVARFELLRALRTWRALAVVVLYVVATCGADWIFIKLIHQLERTTARALGVPVTDVPGAMIDKLVERDELVDMLAGMTGDASLVGYVLDFPLLAVFHTWMGYILIPFVAAMTSSEAIALDVGNRQLRFEAARTGRLEIAYGRWLGQVLLMGVAALVAVVGTWLMGMLAMVGNQPLELGWTLLSFTPRVWLYTLPWVGFGIACSQLTASANWARVLAISGTAASWVVLGLATAFEDDETWGIVADIPLQILPQAWMTELWQPGVGWLSAVAVCAVLGVVMVGLGAPFFARRNL